MVWEMAKKRPAAAQPEGPVAKKPATWQAYADHEDNPDDDPDPERPDASTLTKQQRYLFDKALKSGELPPEVQGKHEAIRQEKNPGYPKQLNAIVNSIVPKNSEYGSQIDFQQPVNLKKFETLLGTQVINHQQVPRIWGDPELY